MLKNYWDQWEERLKHMIIYDHFIQMNILSFCSFSNQLFMWLDRHCVLSGL